MATKRIGSALSLLCCCLLTSGCATQLQKSLDRSVWIAKRCADIEEAVPNRKNIEGELVNAIAVRLVATCFDGSQGCLNPTQGVALPNPVGSADNLLTNLEQHRNILLSMNKQFLQANEKAVTSLQKEQEHVRDDLSQRRRNVINAKTALYGELKKSKAVLGDSLSKARACERRTSCVAALGRELSDIRPELDKKVGNLRDAAKELYAIAQDTQSLAEHTTAILKQYHDALTSTAAAEKQTIEKASDSLKRDTADLVASSAFLAQRIEGGARTLDNLFSAEFQDAATDLMAAKLYEKVANKTVIAIDRLLSQVDRTIDKIDEHAYGAATLGTSFGTYLFQDEMQQEFDRIFTTYVADRLPEDSNTAKLAFVTAACKRLVPDNDNAAPNASLFSPFVYAAIIRMKVDLEGGRETVENVRKESEQNVAKTDSSLPNTEQTSDVAFLGLVANAYEKDMANKKAPSILQQVALCANVEQQLASSQQLPSTQLVSSPELKERSWAACGQTVMSAALTGRALPNAADPALAKNTVNKAESTPFTSTIARRPSVEDAAAWRRAMESVLAASVPKQPSNIERLCQRIRSGVTAVRCEINGSDDAVTLDFDLSFALGKYEDRALEFQIARLADILSDDKQAYVFKVYGYASASAYPCSHSSASTPPACSAEKNYALATARAKWAIDVLRKRLRERFASNSYAVGEFNPLSFDTPADRHIRMTVSLRN